MDSLLVIANQNVNSSHFETVHSILSIFVLVEFKLWHAKQIHIKVYLGLYHENHPQKNQHKINETHTL